MKTYFQCLCLAAIAIFFGSCNEVSEMFEQVFEEQFPQPPHRTIKIKDDVSNTLPTSPRISDINGKDVLLMLTDAQPTLDQSFLTADYFTKLMESVFALGPVKTNAINLKLYTGTMDYWTGSGDYWIIFVLPNKALSRITSVYLSKNRHHIYEENTQLYNIDFLPPYNADLDIDISGALPF